MLNFSAPFCFIWDGDKKVQCHTIEAVGDIQWTLLMISEATRVINSNKHKVVSEPTVPSSRLLSIPPGHSFVYVDYNLMEEKPNFVETNFGREEAIDMLMLTLEIFVTEPCLIGPLLF